MKRLFSTQLGAASEPLASAYLLAGTDPLLLDESRQLILARAREQGFDDTLHLDINGATHWGVLQEHCQSQGLFSRRVVWLVNLPENFTQAISKAFQALLPDLHSDILPVFCVSKLNFQTEKQAWFKALSAQFAQLVIVNCQTPTPEQLPQWLKVRLKQAGLHLDGEAQQLLCHNYESNLLALAQVLKLLALRFGDEKLNFYKVQSCIEQSSQFTPYQWLDALLEGKAKRAMRILHSLENEEMEPLILLRSAQKELSVLLSLAQGNPLNNSHERLPHTGLKVRFDALRIWQSRRHLYQAAMQRLSYRRVFEAISMLAELERALKRGQASAPWECFAELTALLAK
ncbi:DNA polymerase III subunit delta [Pasteurellaceae bacterium HPA106]|uniref:DNA polymerase III subunit delta n=1 Tax=Spirabiliibacterium pneumoniae TaxID=221400 RepID=UPI001AADB611|nr:DNA polymerase III subunit delta [Spirabiliibacterium pneumoniae]MBE2895866.1 DNA polymerase III subunit delta [Spirabiliibacterium pneumoniae]